MADPFSADPEPPDAAAREARRATQALLERVASRRRHIRRTARARAFGLDLLVAMATYTGLTVAAILGAICGLRSLIDFLAG